MIEEVDSAVSFLTRMLSNTRVPLQGDTILTFKEMLQVLMVDHYQNHWFPEKPFKGSGYRCIRIVNQKMDPLLAKAGALVGVSENDLLNVLPREFTMWVDPNEVSYRIGEEGSIGVLFGADADSSSDDSDNCDSNRSTPSPNNNSSPSQELLQQSCQQEQLRTASPATGAAPAPVAQDSSSLNNFGFLTTFVAS